MRIIDWYILKKFLTTFMFVVLILVSIVLIITFSERNESFIKNDIPAKLIIRYFLNYAPYIGNMITPITVFIAATFVTSKMASHTEVIAILSGGVSYPRFLRPFLMGAAIIAVVSFFLTGWVIPNANKYRVAFEIAYFDKEFNYKERDVHFKVSPTSYAYLNSYNSRNDQGYKFTLEEIQDKKLLWKLSAARIKWDTTELAWRLTDWDLRTINEFGEDYTYENIKDTVIHINMSPKDFGNTKSLEQTLTLNELDEYIADLRLKGADNIPVYEIEKLIRFMSPFTAIILTFIGVILSSKKTRGGVGFQIALGFLLAFIFILLFIATKSIAEAGSMNPLFAVWLPNMIFTALALIIYRFVPK